MKTLRVGVVQMDTQNQKDKNLKTAGYLIGEAASRGARLVGLPEYFNFIGQEKEETNQAEPIPGPTTGQIATWAKKHSIWLHGGSILEKAGGKDKFFNTTALFDPQGNIVGRYRKVHLFDIAFSGGPIMEESQTRESGDRIVACSTDLGTIGLTICYDLRFPEIYRILALMGAHMVFVPAMFTLFTGRDHWEPLLRARAIENQYFILAPAQIGLKPQYPCHGRSMVVDPWGTVLAQAPDGEGVAIADLDFDRMAQIRQQLPSLRNRRPEVYQWPRNIFPG